MVTYLDAYRQYKDPGAASGCPGPSREKRGCSLKPVRVDFACSQSPDYPRSPHVLELYPRICLRRQSSVETPPTRFDICHTFSLLNDFNQLDFSQIYNQHS